MQTARSASRVCSAPASAVEYTATASIPSSCSARMTRTAISPRFATRTRENIATGRPASQRIERTPYDGLQLEEQLAELHRLRVLDVDRAHDPVDVRLHLVHELHRLEDAECLARADRLTFLHERWCSRLRCAVERADHRGLDANQAVRRRRRERGLGLLDDAERGVVGDRQRSPVLRAPARHAHARFLDRPPADAGLLDDADELANAFCAGLVDAAGDE